MFSREEIEAHVEYYVKPIGIRHISDMCQGIQEYLFKKAQSKLSYTGDKYLQSRDGIRTSKFMELCSIEDWKYAAGIADRMNREILTQTECFHKFVKMVKTSPEYISIIRNMKLNLIDI